MFSKYWRKGIAIGVILLFIGSCFIPCINGESKIINKNRLGIPIIFGSQYIDISWDASQAAKPIIPGGELRVIDLEVRYGITTGGLLSHFILKFFEGRQVSINLETKNYPDWCTANLKSSVLTLAIEEDEQILNTSISIRLDVDAPASELCAIEISASVEPIDGPFGLFTFIEGYEINTIIQVISG